MTQRTALLTILLSLISVARAAEPAPVRALGLDRVRLLDGPFKQLQELHRTGLVGQLEPDRLLCEFRKTARLPQPPGIQRGYGGWDSGFIAGHYGAHYLSAASRMYAATGDTSFRDKVNYMVKALGECQEKLGDGYLAAFGPDKFERVETEPQRSSVPYYTIHKIMAGLLDAHVHCGNAEALRIAAKMADYFATRIARLTPAQVEAMFRTDYKGNPTNEFGAMAEVLCDLHDLATKNGDANARRHLELAAVFNRAWFIDPLIAGQDKLAGLHGNTHVAQACGLARYALAAGDPRTAKAADAFWSLVVRDHSFAIGGNSFDEKFGPARTEAAGQGPLALSPKTAETCNTHNMLKLSRHLFERRPDAAIADYMELALYNQILATIAPDSGHVTYFTPLRPGDFRTYLNEPYCCQGTGIENAARFGEAICFHQDRTLWINLFTPSLLDWREQGIRLRMETAYPETGVVRIWAEVAAPVDATLNLRIPGWIDGAVGLSINGEKLPADTRPGSYLSLNRLWKSGDVVELTLPISLRIRPSMDDPSTISLFHGPLVLAGELGREQMPPTDIAGKDAFAAAPAWPVPAFVADDAAKVPSLIQPVPGEPLKFDARMAGPDGREIRVRLAPLHRIHHQRFAVYWKVLAAKQSPGR